MTGLHPFRSRRLRHRALRFLLVAFLSATPTIGYAFSLTWPAACTDGTECFTQNYVDHGAGGPARDFTCAALTYPAHDGTDIRLRSLAAMRAGVAVLSPADGIVLRVRDGMADRSIRAPDGDISQGIAALDGKDCGNGAIIRHAEGYETELCHLRQGSLRVTPGQAVNAGQPIGLIGLSGHTEFPHVHLTVRHDGVVVDPYTGMAAMQACGGTATSLWATPHPYHATLMVNDGFAADIPDKEAMRDAPTSLTVLPSDAAALTYWADIAGVQEGDQLTLRLLDPNEKIIAENTKRFDKPLAQYFTFIGKKKTNPWVDGTYNATIVLYRHGAIVLQGTKMIKVQKNS